MADQDDFLTAEDIFGTDDVEYKSVPAWGNKNLLIKSLTAGDMIDFVQSNESKTAKHTAGVRLIIQSAVDKNHEPLFQMSDLERLKRKNSRITNNIVDAILKLNGLDKKSQDAKNASGETEPDASPTVLH